MTCVPCVHTPNPSPWSQSSRSEIKEKSPGCCKCMQQSPQTVAMEKHTKSSQPKPTKVIGEEESDRFLSSSCLDD